eukprot:TRINITY_DN7962_c1_g2_i1.p1 TRINITY_DN7962_c1_g2~~TRINITY_DN7962_c1_g2_i1.p1  ORF type:complete len:101 (+),score=23.98 TRINITY_DN7962_c1_g2_i1:30-305(+)
MPSTTQFKFELERETRSGVDVIVDGRVLGRLESAGLATSNTIADNISPFVKVCMSNHPLPTVIRGDEMEDWLKDVNRVLGWNAGVGKQTLR